MLHVKKIVLVSLNAINLPADIFACRILDSCVSQCIMFSFSNVTYHTLPFCRIQKIFQSFFLLFVV